MSEIVHIDANRHPDPHTAMCGDDSSDMVADRKLYEDYNDFPNWCEECVARHALYELADTDLEGKQVLQKTYGGAGGGAITITSGAGGAGYTG